MIVLKKWCNSYVLVPLGLKMVKFMFGLIVSLAELQHATVILAKAIICIFKKDYIVTMNLLNSPSIQTCTWLIEVPLFLASGRIQRKIGKRSLSLWSASMCNQLEFCSFLVLLKLCLLGRWIWQAICWTFVILLVPLSIM